MVVKKHALALALLGASISPLSQAQSTAAPEPTSAERIAAAQSSAQASAAQTYAVTIALIQELVNNGVLSLEKAQAMIDHAEKQATLARQNQAAAVVPATVRVPYIPESVKKEMREELRQEVAQQAKDERWGEPGALPGWLSRIDIGGDFRLRWQGDYFDSGNFPYVPDVQAINDAGGVTTVNGFPFVNTTDDRQRLRYRARLNIGAKVTDDVKVNLTLASGEDNGPVSTNKTFGDYLRKDSIWLDRAYLEAKLADGVTFTGGRLPNPFFSTDLVWDADLNFEGAALSGNYPLNRAKSAAVFGTIGLFPLQERARYANRWLRAGQLGGTATLGETRFKVGLAYYDFENVQSKMNPADGSRLNDYSKPPLLAQGNSVFNMRTDGVTTLAGLASEFRLANLTAQAEYPFAADKVLRLTTDYVRNLAMDEKEIARLRGEPGVEPGDTGWQVRVFVGHPKINKRNDWNFEVGYKRLETDAVLDAFTDSDFGAYGGTDLKGYTLEGNYGVANNTWVTLRWLSADAISRPPFSSDVLQLDLNTRF